MIVLHAFPKVKHNPQKYIINTVACYQVHDFSVNCVMKTLIVTE